KPDAAAEAVSAAESAAAARRARRVRISGAKIEAVHRHHLQPARRFLQIAHNGRALGQVGLSGGNERRGMTEGVAAVFKSDKAKSLRGIEPFDRALHRGHREGA